MHRPHTAPVLAATYNGEELAAFRSLTGIMALASAKSSTKTVAHRHLLRVRSDAGLRV